MWKFGFSKIKLFSCFFQIVHSPSPLMSSLSLTCSFKAIICEFLALGSNIYSQYFLSSVIPIFYFVPLTP